MIKTGEMPLIYIAGEKKKKIKNTVKEYRYDVGLKSEIGVYVGEIVRFYRFNSNNY